MYRLLHFPSLVPVSKSSARIIPFVVLPVLIEKVLCDSKIDNLKSDASEIIEMVLFSSTRILVSFKLVSDFFSSPRSPTRASNPDEVVVYDAAVQDAIIYSPATPLKRLLLNLNVTPLSLGIGIETAGGVMPVMTLLSSVTITIPIKTPRFSSTYSDNNTVCGYTREPARIEDNLLLGKFKFELSND